MYSSVLLCGKDFRMSLPDFQLVRPRTLPEAMGFLREHHNIRILAGGTDLLPSMRQKLFEPDHVLDIRHLPELKGIRETGQGTEIGALTTLGEIEHSSLLRQHYPVLVEAAKTVASPVLRNMGTIGGNICLDTRCLWYNQSLRTIKLSDFYSGDGSDHRRLQPNELLTRIFLPRASAGYLGTYRKLRIRGSIDYPLAGVAVVVKKSNGHVEDLRIGITAVNPAPLLVKGVDSILNGNFNEVTAEAIAEQAARTAKPLTTSALTPEYRREMIRVFTKRAVLALSNG